MVTCQLPEPPLGFRTTMETSARLSPTQAIFTPSASFPKWDGLAKPLRAQAAGPEGYRLTATEDGVLLHIGGRTATFLPQVWAQIPDKVQFLEHLSQKAGCEASAWRGKDVSVEIYHVECFEEEHTGA